MHKLRRQGRGEGDRMNGLFRDRVADERRQGRGEGVRMCSCLMYRTTNDANYTNDKDRRDKMDRRVGGLSSKKLNITNPLKF